MKTNEQIVHDLAEAWRTLNPELLIQHLAPEFQYDSMWVFASLDHNGYVDYIRSKFKAIKNSGSHLTVQEIPGQNAIALVQDSGEPTYYIIEIRDGKIVKGDLTAFLM